MTSTAQIQHVQPIWKQNETWLSLEETKAEKRFEMKYLKTYNFKGAYIDAFHRWLFTVNRHENGMIDIGIDGWLLPQDALKLYEMAYFSGDILELGTYKGLSTSIICNAVFNSGRPRPIVTVDLSPELSLEAKEDMQKRLILGKENVSYFVFDAIAFVDNLAEAGRKFSFAFIDHSHVYEHVKSCCVNLHRVIEPGGFVLFHDYNDPRNAHEACEDYGVYQGVNDGLSNFEFYGIYGCTSLWRRLPL